MAQLWSTVWYNLRWGAKGPKLFVFHIKTNQFLGKFTDANTHEMCIKVVILKERNTSA